MEADVYVWCYAFLVVHARKEKEEDVESVSVCVTVTMITHRNGGRGSAVGLFVFTRTLYPGKLDFK